MYPAKLPAHSGTGIKIVLGMVPAFCVRGEVRSRTGVLPPHFTISVAEPAGDGLYFILHGNGRFLLTAFPSGDYIIEVRRFGKLGFQAPLTRQRIAIKGNMDRLTVWILQRKFNWLRKPAVVQRSRRSSICWGSSVPKLYCETLAYGDRIAQRQASPSGRRYSKQRAKIYTN